MMFLRACARVVRGARLPQASAVGLHPRPTLQRVPAASHVWRPVIPYRPYGTGKTAADEIIDEITEQYATAKDEFEIAVEETEKNTLYAAEDRAAAAEEMEKLKEMYSSALNDHPEEVAADVKRRIGSRIRELDEAIKGLEESAQQGD